MQITNCGRGIHKREVKGVDRFKSALPSAWYAFTNLDLALGAGRAREIDIIVVSDHRIFVIDLKDWNGQIKSVDGRWEENGNDRGSSPVAKINGIARDISILLKNAMAKRPETKGRSAPKIEGLVVISGTADRSGISPTELSKVLTVDEFLASVSNNKSAREKYGNIFDQFLAEPLTENIWKNFLSHFFNAGPSSPFKSGRRSFERYVAEETASYAHPKDIYREYEAQEDGTPPSLGTLRLWDFTKLSDTRFQTEEGRREIAGRERHVYHWLRDRSERLERNLLTPRIDDPFLGVHYWEIYDRRRRLKRLSDFANTEARQLSRSERIELARQLLSGLAEMHRHDAAHLDLGSHSIWLEAPTTVRLSHLFAARFSDVKSLGPARYQFLASVELPEDVLGHDHGALRRDVYLAGVATHQILFGKIPDGRPPEWNASIDIDGAFEALHDWFGEALDINPERRFSDASAALEAYNKATVEHPTPEEVIDGLDGFRGPVRSQMALLKAYPMDGAPLYESDSIDAWRSTHEGKPVIVKMWKQAAWGDLKREGPRILAFLQRARELAADEPAAVPTVCAILWLGDAIGLVQQWVIGTTLDLVIVNPPDTWRTPEVPIAIILKLILAVDRLHESGHGHGDLKPDNIVIADGGEIFLIDILDFSPLLDSDKQNSAYAPNGGNRLERDRFAVTKIAEEIFSLTELKPEYAVELSRAISICRDKEPRLATLLPLKEAAEKIQDVLTRPADAAGEQLHLSLSIRNAVTGPLESDEGYFYLRIYPASERGSATLHVRGAAEEIEIKLDERGNPLTARRRQLGQTQISIVARHEFHRLPIQISVTRSDLTNLSDLEVLLIEPTVRAQIDVLRSKAKSGLDVVVNESDEIDLEGDSAQESLAEEIAAVPEGSDDQLRIDIPLLWQTLVNTEKELTTEGVTETDSVFDRVARRHRVSFDLQSGSFDFDRNDTVGVLKQDNKGGWRRIGELDIQRSRSSVVMVDATDYSGATRLRLVEAGQRLRFVSHFETESLRRRSSAVERILGGSKREANLLSVFDPRTNAKPTFAGSSVDDDDLAQYELNTDQKVAFKKLVNARPVGLLQGPPGTGKTRFIAALAHYALTKKLVSNVLLSSQSHEAVNTVGEAFLKLFRKTGGEPSILRVAMSDDQVSDLIRPFHTRRVEQAYKDRFEAEFHYRQAIIGKALGIQSDLTDNIVDIDTVIRPIVSLLIQLNSSEVANEQRVSGLQQSLAAHIERLQLRPELAYEIGEDAEAFVQNILDLLLSKQRGADALSPDKLARLRATIRLGQDFIGSASRAQRSFETFLAGTRQVVLGTCVGLGRAALGLTTTAFDLVIVDEAARCSASELLVPLQAARWTVLVGDQAQLQPQHEAAVINRVAELTGISKKEIQRSDFERVFLTGYAKDAADRLKTQYRMLSPIGQLVSEAFYPSLMLEAGRSDPIVPPEILPLVLSHPVTWVTTDELGEIAFDKEKEEGGSRTNRAEVDIIVAMLSDWVSQESFQKWLSEQTVTPIPIGVICTYAAQRDLMHHHLLRSSVGHLLGNRVKVGTVDSYQGKENPIVILSLVRHNRDGVWENGAKTIREGFLSSPNRINVAASRAMDRLIIVGAHQRWRTDGPMGNLAAAFSRRMAEGTARIVGAEDLLNEKRAPAAKGTIQKAENLSAKEKKRG